VALIGAGEALDHQHETPDGRVGRQPFQTSDVVVPADQKSAGGRVIDGLPGWSVTPTAGAVDHSCLLRVVVAVPPGARRNVAGKRTTVSSLRRLPTHSSLNAAVTAVCVVTCARVANRKPLGRQLVPRRHVFTQRTGRDVSHSKYPTSGVNGCL